MRVLITTWNWNTLYFPLVPLAWSLRAQGHEVVVATQPGLVGTVLRSGLPAAAVGESVDAGAMMGGFLRRLADAEGVNPPHWRDMRRHGTLNCRLGVAACWTMMDGLLDFARRWRPDVVLYEAWTYAGPMVADLLGVPAIRHTWGIDYAGLFREFEAEALAEVRAHWGLDEVPSLAAVSVDPCPPQLQVVSPGSRLLMQYVPYNGPGVLPDWLHEPSPRKRVCVSWGTSSGRFDRKMVVTGQVVRAVAGLDVEVVAAVTAADADLIGELPANVRVVSGVPFNALLPRCDLVISHAGLGTVMTALASGTPQLLVPQMTDTALNAELLAENGCGEFVLPSDATDEVLREKAARMLGDPAFSAATASVRDAMRQLPTPNEMAAHLTSLNSSMV
ncbi:nucleotide disphospho-sugar-binding domain-containing protein [Amycolatopsis mediterranei]|uniref:nucleotide disphospho-sugar-binding domain-containing protein n=1 Tax=Amycolatopsis mediterranei TaxID=33910 RepID=UPI0034315ED8